MMILLAGAAAMLSTATEKLFQLSDYPRWALQEEASAAALIRLVIDPGGKVVQCTASNTFGDARLAREICPIIQRKRLPGATTRDGTRIQVVEEMLYQLFQPFTKAGMKIAALREVPDAELMVNKLPGGKAADVRVVLQFDRDGKVVDCGPKSKEEQADLASAACRQGSIFNGAIERDVTGRAVPYLTTKKVRFVLAAHPAAAAK